MTDKASVGSEIVDTTKNVGIVLSGVSGLAYACGYLVLRARSRALGTDPGFAFIDQAYVFAGFRFALALLFSLLVMVPVLLALYAVGRILGKLQPRQLYAVEVPVAVFLGGATVWAYVATLGVSGLLLAPLSDWIGDAALGRNNYGTVIQLMTTGAAAATVLWFNARFMRRAELDGLGLVVALIGALLLVLLPMQHGVFNADRNARRLDRVPDGLTGIEPPVWLVDRGASDRVVLYGHTADGQARLMTLKDEKLEGIAVTGVSSLGAVMGERKP
jgi:hypothetical protein